MTFKAVEFELLNFNEFIGLNAKNNWLKYLNSNVTVNLNDKNDIKKNINNLMELYFTDFGK